MNNKVVRIYLTGAFLLSYIMWGIIILAQELNWFQYGSPVSLVFVMIGANSPAIITYFVFKKYESDFTLIQYLKEAFMIKQRLSLYMIVLILIAVFLAYLQ